MIIGVCGNIGSGKGAVSEYLQTKYNFKHVSFADSLKEAVSAIFGWNLEMLRGATPESRAWREIVDPWWANRLNIPELTPRWILQRWGTEVGRRSFHQDIWIASLERKLVGNLNDIVIDDCRFINEIGVIRNQNGILIKINRGENPIWYETALSQLQYNKLYGANFEVHDTMTEKYPDIHISEWGWIDQEFDYEIDNSGTLEELHRKLDEIIEHGAVA
jgi:hypothetical protein